MLARACGFDSRLAHHVGASCISLAPTFFKSQSALIALLLLSKSNPLRWASIWFWAQSRKKIDFAALVHVGAKSAPLRFKAVPFGDRLKTALRSFAPPFQLEPAALGFELAFGA